ncbi:TetR/AcrR family transcriptional regulator [Pseudomonas chlororaphis subsp. aurantiaca]|nr:TetR/AcrR family transcriptional regulator [Pseudomonas chlororaphis subsp. aurantiaca]
MDVQVWCSTSLSQLKEGIGGGISAPSFYAAFGSKEALFKEVLERYLDTHGRVTEGLFDEHLAPRDAIESTLRRSARMQCETSHPRGCLIALGVMDICSVQDPAVSAPLIETRTRDRAGLVACIERGMALGELPADTDPPAMAAVFDSFMLGLSVLARDGMPHELLDTAVTQIMMARDA